eukprot:755438-Heterocapsa_arctica.AAC.1
MPGECHAVAGAFKVPTRTLAMMHTRGGSSELLKIIPKPRARPTRDVHLGGELTAPCTGHIKTGAETPARRGSRAH